MRRSIDRYTLAFAAGEKNPVATPITSSGAVSPKARARVRTVPVRIPGAAAGSTWFRITSQRVAPTPNPASRMLFGTARSASAAVMITIGSTSTASVIPAAMMFFPLVDPPSPIPFTMLDEDRQAEQPVDDRRHPGQVAHGGVDQPRRRVVGCVLLEVDGGGDPDRERQHGDDGGDDHRPDDGGRYPGRLRTERQAGR